MSERQHRSVSQYNQYTKCPQAWFLERVQRAWQRPAAWLPQGSAVHSVAEHYEKAKLQGEPMTLEQAETLFGEEYSKEVEKYTEITPNLEYWFRSGPYAGAQDIERRYGIGREQVGKYLTWSENTPERVVWIAPDGTPGIELGFDFELDGVLVRGFIDRIDEVDGQVEVIDVKTGNNPGDDFQLGVYGVALAEQFGISPPQSGAYWMGRSGKLTYPFDIGEWTRERVSEKFRELEENIAAGRFDPDPEPSKCRFCGVNLSCEYSLA